MTEITISIGPDQLDLEDESDRNLAVLNKISQEIKSLYPSGNVPEDLEVNLNIKAGSYQEFYLNDTVADAPDLPHINKLNIIGVDSNRQDNKLEVEFLNSWQTVDSNDVSSITPSFITFYGANEVRVESIAFNSFLQSDSIPLDTSELDKPYTINLSVNPLANQDWYIQGVTTHSLFDTSKIGFDMEDNFQGKIQPVTLVDINVIGDGKGNVAVAINGVTLPVNNEQDGTLDAFPLAYTEFVKISRQEGYSPGNVETNFFPLLSGRDYFNEDGEIVDVQTFYMKAKNYGEDAFEHNNIPGYFADEDMLFAQLNVSDDGINFVVSNLLDPDFDDSFFDIDRLPVIQQGDKIFYRGLSDSGFPSMAELTQSMIDAAAEGDDQIKVLNNDYNGIWLGGGFDIDDVVFSEFINSDVVNEEPVIQTAEVTVPFSFADDRRRNPFRFFRDNYVADSDNTGLLIKLEATVPENEDLSSQLGFAFTDDDGTSAALASEFALDEETIASLIASGILPEGYDENSVTMSQAGSYAEMAIIDSTILASGAEVLLLESEDGKIFLWSENNLSQADIGELDNDLVSLDETGVTLEGLTGDFTATVGIEQSIVDENGNFVPASVPSELYIPQIQR